MKLISDYYKEQNRKLHETHNDYGQKGGKHITMVKQLRDRYKCKTVLDYGCGGAGLSKNAEFEVINYDPGIPEYDIAPEPADLVVCTDVLEHIEPELLDNVLKHLRELTLQVGYFVIATRPDRSKTLPDGSNPHRIIENAGWWIDRLSGHFIIERSRDHGGREVSVIVE